MSAQRVWAQCAVCGWPIYLRRDGKIKQHNDNRLNKYRPSTCAGSDEPPTNAGVFEEKVPTTW